MRGLLAIALLVFTLPAVAELEPGDDGWQTWRIEKQATVGELCCYRNGRKAGCDLDGKHGTHRVDDAAPLSKRFARVYARLLDGEVQDVHTLSDSCPVTTATPMNDLGLIDNGDSVAWLSSKMASSNADEILLSLSLHAGDAAFESLVASSREGRPNHEREQAVFWMAQHRGADARTTIVDFARRDSSRQFREHAVFALSQLPDGDNVDALESVLADRSFPMNSRKQALFWLAQTDSDEAFAAIDRLLDPGP